MLRRLPLQADPAEVLRAWPTERPLAVLWSGAAAGRWSRWSIFAQPVGTLRTDATGTRWHGHAGAAPRLLDPSDPLAAVAAAAHAAPRPSVLGRDADVPPFRGGWIGSLGYELGHALEPASARAPRSDEARHGAAPGGWPLAVLHWCPAAYVHDRLTNQWWVVGDESAAGALPDLSRAEPPAASPAPVVLRLDEESLHEERRRRYVDGVARIVEYIRAGDVFQANLAHVLQGTFTGSPRDLFAAMIEAASPWYGAYIEDAPDRGIEQAALSISPELFLDFDGATRLVTTRPIKGTARGEAGAGALEDSAKDAAELAMIVDLMRNDLGRVCEFGSIHVTEARTVEAHARRGGQAGGAGLLHGVATIRGRLRSGLTIPDLLRAAFPGGSITGAPKIRAMQIIRECEGCERGPYTGAIGYLSDCGHACFNIAIRTAHVSRPVDGPWTWRYHAGAGIVADSDPESEWDETLAKAEIMLRLADAHEPGSSAIRR